MVCLCTITFLSSGQVKWKKVKLYEVQSIDNQKSKSKYESFLMHKVSGEVGQYRSLDTFYNKPNGYNGSIKNVVNVYNSDNKLSEFVWRDTSFDETGFKDVSSSKVLFYYNSKQKGQAKFYFIDEKGGNAFQLISKDSFFYNNQDKITDEISYTKNIDSIDYISDFIKYGYDSNNCLNYEETTYLDEVGDILSSSRNSFINDASCNSTYRKRTNYNKILNKYEIEVEYFTKINYNSNYTEFFTFIKKNFIEDGMCQFPDSFIIRNDKKGRLIKEWQWCDANHVQFQYGFDAEDKINLRGFKVQNTATKEWSGYIEYYKYDNKSNFIKTIWMPYNKQGSSDSSKLKIYTNTFKYDNNEILLQENYVIKLDYNENLKYDEFKYLERYCENSPKKIRVETNEKYNNSSYNTVSNYSYEYFDLPCSTDTENLETDNGKIVLYPNPAQEEINVDLFGYVNRYKSGVWELYDIQGQRVAFYPIFENKSEYRYDIAPLNNGMYFWRVIFDGKIGQSGKLVILK